MNQVCDLCFDVFDAQDEVESICADCAQFLSSREQARRQEDPISRAIDAEFTRLFADQGGDA